MAWLTYTSVNDRWPLYENFSPYPSADTSAQAWVGTLITDAQAELETLIPPQFADEAAVIPTPAALVSAGYYLTRAKVLEWFYSTKGRGTTQEEIDALRQRAIDIVNAWVEAQKFADEMGGISFMRLRRKDPFWERSEDEGVEADYEL